MTNELINSPLSLAEEIVKILIEKKGVNVRLFNVTGKTSITDFYINVTGRSSTQVASLADNLCEKLREYGISELPSRLYVTFSSANWLVCAKSSSATR